MQYAKACLNLIAGATLSLGCVLPAQADLDSIFVKPDSYSFEIGNGNRTQLARIGAQWDWDKKWWQSNGTHIGGYWNLDVSWWHGNRYDDQRGAKKDLATIGFTPVFRFQSDDKLGAYGEFGVGAHLLSRRYNNNGKRLSTNFQFGSLLGTGYVFDNKLDLGVRVQHFSNGGIKEPNSGVNFVILRAAYPF